MKTNGEDFVFPASVVVLNGHHKAETGLTKREYFTGLAMQGLMANNSMIDGNGTIIMTKHQMAKIAVISADSLIEQLNLKEDENIKKT
jgi:hypothetical protein